MATIKDDKQGAIRRKSGDKMLMKSITIDLATALEIHRTDSVENTGRMHSSRILHLSAVARIMEEVARSRLTDKPIDRSLSTVSQYGRKSG